LDEWGHGFTVPTQGTSGNGGVTDGHYLGKPLSNFGKENGMPVDAKYLLYEDLSDVPFLSKFTRTNA
jgi:hypothetical protein